MGESRWLRRIGPVVAATGFLAAVASTTAGAPPVAWSPPACAGPPAHGAAGIGAWYRLDPTIADGVLVGQRLTLGRSGEDGPVHLDLGAESFASGPFGGTILVGTDDGRASQLSLLDLGTGCVWQLAPSPDVIRHATVTPGRRSLVEFRVDRRTRSDLGVWSLPLDGGRASRILGPIGPDPRFGPTWLTELSWSEDGRTLVVESCGEVACRMRLHDVATGATEVLADPTIGDVVGVVDDRIVARGACRGLPCPVVALSRRGDPAVILDDAAGQAILARDADGLPLVVHELDVDGRAVRAIRPDGRDARPMPASDDGRRLIGKPGWSGSAAEHAHDWVLFAADGRLPLPGNQPAVARHVPDGRTVPLDEVPR